MKKHFSGLFKTCVCGVMLLTGVSCEKMNVEGADDEDSKANVVLRIGVVMAAYTALGYFINSLLPEPSLFMLLVRIAVFSLTFLPVLWFLIANAEEKQMITEKISALKKKIAALKKRPADAGRES